MMNIVKRVEVHEGDGRWQHYFSLKPGETVEFTLLDCRKPYKMYVTRVTRYPCMHQYTDPNTFETSMTWCHKFEVNPMNRGPEASWYMYVPVSKLAEMQPFEVTLFDRAKQAILDLE